MDYKFLDLNGLGSLIEKLKTIFASSIQGVKAEDAYEHSLKTSGNPHNVTKSDVGLGNVENFKAVSTVASQGLTDTEKSNARTNIGAGTSSFSGNYNDLTNKPTLPTVNNATLTIQKNGTDVGTFTANASANKDINITVPTKTSELTNDSGYKTTDNNTTYTLTKSGSTILLTGSDGSKTSVTDSNTTYTLSSFGITATADEINKLDGVTATTTELNYVDGVTSNIQTQLNGKLSTTGTAAKATADATGQNISVTYIKGLSISGNTITYTKGDGGTGTITLPQFSIAWNDL